MRLRLPSDALDVWIDLHAGTVGVGGELFSYRGAHANAHVASDGTRIEVNRAEGTHRIALQLPPLATKALAVALGHAPRRRLVRELSRVDLRKQAGTRKRQHSTLALLVCVVAPLVAVFSDALPSLVPPMVGLASISILLASGSFFLGTAGPQRVFLEADRLVVLHEDGVLEYPFAEFVYLETTGKEIKLERPTRAKVVFRIAARQRATRQDPREHMREVYESYHALKPFEESEHVARRAAESLAEQLRPRLARSGRSLADWRRGLADTVQPSHRAAAVDIAQLIEVVTNERIETELRVAAGYALSRSADVSRAANAIATTARVTRDAVLRSALDALLVDDADEAGGDALDLVFEARRLEALRRDPNSR